MDIQFTSTVTSTHISSIKFCISLHSLWLTYTHTQTFAVRENHQMTLSVGKTAKIYVQTASQHCIHHLISGSEIDSRMWKRKEVFMHACMRACLKSVNAKAKPKPIEEVGDGGEEFICCFFSQYANMNQHYFDGRRMCQMIIKCEFIRINLCIAIRGY